MIDKLLDRIRKNVIANRIMAMAGCISADKILILVLYKYYEKHPTTSMKESQRYFNEHKKDIKEITGWLADKKSKQIWCRIIKFRKTMNYKYHPGKESAQYFVDDIIHYDKHEVFIDCGGYDGMTSLEFINHAISSGGV